MAMMVHDLEIFIRWLLADTLSALPARVLLWLIPGPEFPARVSDELVSTFLSGMAWLIGTSVLCTLAVVGLVVLSLRGGNR